MFFIPTNIEHLQFSRLSLSAPLMSALKKLHLYRLGDLSGISQSDFHSVSRDSSHLIKELNDIINSARIAKTNSVAKLNLTDARKATEEQQPCILVDQPPEESQTYSEPTQMVFLQPNAEQDAIFIPEAVQSLPPSSFPVSVRLTHIFEYKGFKQLGDLNSYRFTDFLSFRNCERKTVDELRELVARAGAG